MRNKYKGEPETPSGRDHTGDKSLGRRIIL
jgi:hypothetical protein